MEGKKLGGTSIRAGPRGYIKKRSDGASVTTVGDDVGALVLVGLRVGRMGFRVGSHVGCAVSDENEGWAVASTEGAAVGRKEGFFEGDDVGFELGLALSGSVLSEEIGAADFVGALVGFLGCGFLEGLLVDGLRVGLLTGAFEKNAVGTLLGEAAQENICRVG